MTDGADGFHAEGASPSSHRPGARPFRRAVLCGTSDQPDLAGALDPISGAIVRALGAPPAPGNASASRCHRPRSRQRAGSRRNAAFRPADRRAEVHHRLDEVARPVRRHHPQHNRSISLATAASDRLQPRDDALDIGVDRRRLLAEGNRGNRGRRVGADARQLRSSAAVRESRRAPRPPARRRSGCGRGRSSRGPPIRRGCPRPGGGKRLDCRPARHEALEPRRTVATVVCWSITSLSQTR